MISTPKMSYKAIITPEVKWVSQSESTDRGRPHRLNTSFNSRTAVVMAVSLGAERLSSHLVVVVIVTFMVLDVDQQTFLQF